MKTKYITLSSVPSVLNTLAAFATLASLTACGDDFLTEEPASSVVIDGYYESNSRILESAIAAYDPMQWFDYFDGWAPLSLTWDCLADDIYVGGGSTSDQGQLHLISQYRSDASNNISGLWTACYSGINRSIRLIDNAEASSLISEEQRKGYVAEGRALRSWYYSVLWKTWGNVPYYEENLSEPYLAKQLTADEIYQKIAADLEQVLEMNVLPMRQAAGLEGRMTQAAVAMTYADVVMLQADQSRYAKALKYMEDIIGSTQYDLVSAQELWDVTNECNDEIIMDINYVAAGGKRGWGDAQASGGTVLPAMIGIDGFTSDEPSPEFQGGWGFCTVSKEVYDDYEATDLRRDQGILNMDAYIKDKAAQGYTVSYGGRYQNTGYFLRKYLPRPGGNSGCAGDADLNWDYNLHIYRFAETLLNAAELAQQTGDATKAQTYYDRVRTRAGVPSREASIDNILDERRLEFVGEGKRYFDLVRSGKAAQTLTAGGGKLLQDKETMTWGGQAIPERTTWTPTKRYLQIPQGEIEATASKGEFTIVQNPK